MLYYETNTDEKKIDSIIFKQIVGSVRYLCNNKPDISFVVSLISRFMYVSRKSHMNVARRMLRYLNNTICYCIMFVDPQTKKKHSSHASQMWTGVATRLIKEALQVICLNCTIILMWRGIHIWFLCSFSSYLDRISSKGVEDSSEESNHNANWR